MFPKHRAIERIVVSSIGRIPNAIIDKGSIVVNRFGVIFAAALNFTVIHFGGPFHGIERIDHNLVSKVKSVFCTGVVDCIDAIVVPTGVR